MRKLILIRHGETEFNAESKYCGFSDPPLNSKGIFQSKSLRNKFKEFNIDRVYSSDLKRAYGTAKIVFKNHSIEKKSEFRELNFGVFEGLKYEEILQRYPKIYREWIDNPLETKIPEGESGRDLIIRIRRQIYHFFTQYLEETVAIVTHGGSIGVILTDILNCSSKNFWQIQQDIASYNIINFSEGLASY